ncbi:DUF2569 domain-containing protein [Pseudorhodoferax sp.]|uniref:DUF2569 domain-containing protein n=1 Tax=Pseudorhodoferax sp. TaxID=1993553 RepID=UPI0039E36356
MRKTALASSLSILALLALGGAGIHSVEQGAAQAGTISLALVLLALPYLAFCLARPAARRGWTIAAWALNGSMAVLMGVLAAFVLLTGFAVGLGLFVPFLVIVATTGINLAALWRARPAGGEGGADGDAGTPGGPVGLRGWLLPLGAIVVVAPVRLAMQLYPWCRDLFLDGTWQAVGDPGHPAYNPLWQPVIAGELMANIGLLALWVFVAYLFLSKKKAFRRCFIALLVATPLLLAVDGALTHAVLPDEPVPDPDLLKEFFGAVAAALIWGPYVLVSRRVKATFVN